MQILRLPMSHVSGAQDASVTFCYPFRVKGVSVVASGGGAVLATGYFL